MHCFGFANSQSVSRLLLRFEKQASTVLPPLHAVQHNTAPDTHVRRNRQQQQQQQQGRERQQQQRRLTTSTPGPASASVSNNVVEIAPRLRQDQKQKEQRNKQNEQSESQSQQREQSQAAMQPMSALDVDQELWQVGNRGVGNSRLLFLIFPLRKFV
jgi:hypothetical protein